MTEINKHIEDFLDYYYKFPVAPEYAILIKGAWGAGKSWFIKKSLEKLKASGGKYIYVSLYGITSYEEIENSFFQQLHPVLSSKSMTLTGKIAKGLLKTTLKIDLDDDGKSDGSISGQVPEIRLPEYLTNTEGFVLVFDDLERCSIKIRDILGYINHFVEHQGYKAIIIANEDEIIEREKKSEKTDISYRRIKEKLIGKTFKIKPDLDNALNSFISNVETAKTKKLYEKHKKVIEELYISSKYENLRHLKQALWDFERLFCALSPQAKKKEDLLVNLLELYLIYSFEIKSGSLLPDEISSLKISYCAELFKADKEEEKKSPYKKISKKYKNINFHETIIEESLWVDIFDKGLIDSAGIDESLLKSIYFQTENTPNWVKLWHALDLTDEEFQKCFTCVEKKYKNKEYDEVGLVKHVTGLLLWLSDIGIYKSTKKEVLDYAKSYASHLKDSGKILIEAKRPLWLQENNSWGGLGFHGIELPEFKEFCMFLEIKLEEARVENFPDMGKELLGFLKSDTDKFYRMLVFTNHEDSSYYKTPILQHINPKEFVECFISISSKNRRTVGCAIEERYKFDDLKENLKEELDWLKSIKKLLTKHQQSLKGKISGYLIGSIIKDHLDKAIIKLS